MNEPGFYDRLGEAGVQEWTTIDVTRVGDGHPYADARSPDSRRLGYLHTFINQASNKAATTTS